MLTVEAIVIQLMQTPGATGKRKAKNMSATTTKKHPQRNFRPWPENQREFEFAEKQRFNVSEILNELVARHFRRHLTLKLHAQQRAMKSLSPARGKSARVSKAR